MATHVVLGSSRGFTLAELAVVLVIASLLLVGLLVPLGTQFELKGIETTKKTLEEIREALLGYAVNNGRLPCPDTTGDGLEDRSIVLGIQGCAAANYEGNLPWATLGVGDADAWGNRFRYRVTNEFTRAQGDPLAAWAGCDPPPGPPPPTDPNLCTVQLGDQGNIMITARGDDPATGAIEAKNVNNVATNVPAVVISLGKNGFGATTANGSIIPNPPPANVDETSNTSAGTTKTFRSRTAPSTTCNDVLEGQVFCEFDDLGIWISSNVFIGRLVAVGKLP